MNNILVLTTATVLILGFTMELAATAERVSDKTLDFSNQMEDALPCAFEARPLEECSPGFGNQHEDLKAEATAFTVKVEDFEEDLAATLPSTTEASRTEESIHPEERLE